MGISANIQDVLDEIENCIKINESKSFIIKKKLNQ
jgi:hypothetical protein